MGLLGFGVLIMGGRGIFQEPSEEDIKELGELLDYFAAYEACKWIC